MKHRISLTIFACLCAGIAGKAQVTIGTLQDPHRGALIHLRTTNENVPANALDTLGMKLTVVALRDTAHLNLGDALIYNLDVDETATGMVVYNTTNDPCGRGLIPCLYVWDGATWRPAGCPFPQCAPSGSPVWEKNPYVGAFWRDNQTGERIIVGTASPTTPWKVDVDDPSGAGNWLTLAVGRHNNATLYTPMPDNAENYPVTSGVTHIEAVGDIVFRIGATGINPQTDANYDTGKRPRYATVTLTVLTNPVKVYTLYCRQGESADYLFRNNDASDPLRGGTGSGAVRTASKRFSPYNLKGTVPSMTYWDTPIAGGEFVEYPTQAGSFWQWGTDLAGGGKTANLRYAYHPTSPVGAISGWDRDYNYHANNDTWHEFTGNNRLETCPPGWRRPMAGDTTSLHDNVAANAADSEVMQSLFYNTFDGSTLNVDNANYRYWGYYADGYFDRYPIDYGVGTPVSIRNAVEPRSEKVAYFGVIYTNPNTKASLFVPASGSRKTSSTYTNGSDDGFSGSLYASAGSYETNTGIEYYYWTSSAKDSYIAWMWAGGYSATNSADRIARQYGYGYRTSGVSVRCVRDE